VSQTGQITFDQDFADPLPAFSAKQAFRVGLLKLQSAGSPGIDLAQRRVANH
jgi:hypothetical protein